jgi:hypothetical protein
VELGGEGAEDLGHHDAVQSSPIDGRIGNIEEDVVVEGEATKREKHEITPPLVVRQRGFQNNRDHRSYVLEAGSLRMQVRGEGSVEVGAGVDGAIIVVLRKRDLLGSGKLLFQVTSNVGYWIWCSYFLDLLGYWIVNAPFECHYTLNI